jgi:site-specific recombinase XerD
MIMETMAEKSPSTIHNYTNITYNVEIAGRPNTDKTFNLYLRITQNRKHRRQKLFPIPAKGDFNPKAKYGQWIRTSNPESVSLNIEIDKAIKKAKEAATELNEEGTASREAIIRKLKGTDSSDFFQFAANRLQYIYDTGGYRNYKKYNNTIKRLREYAKADTLSFSAINYDFVMGFEAYLKKQPNKRKPEFNLNKNSIAVHLIVLRAILKQAEASKLLKPGDNPFLSYKMKGEATRKEKLSVEEIEAIEGLELPENSLIWNCRNYFLFSFYCAGIRAGDLIILKWQNITPEGRLEYTMGKTSCNKSIKLLPQALKIIDYYVKDGKKPKDYIFPLLDNSAPYAIATTEEERESLPVEVKVKMYNDMSAKNALINKYLHKIAKLAKITKPVSFHIARHSFADIARRKGISVYDISNMLAHSSIKITEAYLKNFDSESMDNSMERIFK